MYCRYVILFFLFLSFAAGCGNEEPSPEPTGFFCSDCGREIAEGESYWCINVNHETFDSEAVTVLESTMVECYCETCAGKRNFSNIYVPHRR